MRVTQTKTEAHRWPGVNRGRDRSALRIRRAMHRSGAGWSPSGNDRAPGKQRQKNEGSHDMFHGPFDKRPDCAAFVAGQFNILALISNCFQGLYENCSKRPSLGRSPYRARKSLQVLTPLCRRAVHATRTLCNLHRANVTVGMAGAKSGCTASFQTGFRSTFLDPRSRRQAQHPFPQLIVLAAIELRPDDDTAGYFIPAELRRVFR
jgi:hypothetical protein